MFTPDREQTPDHQMVDDRRADVAVQGCQSVTEPIKLAQVQCDRRALVIGQDLPREPASLAC